MTLVEFLTNHTFRMVVLGTSGIGLVAGALGVFAYVRKQSLMSDVVSHAALPGVLGAFLITTVFFKADGRSMGILLIGATITGTIAALTANWVTRISKVRIDAAMSVILAMFFGAGMLLLQIIGRGDFDNKGGIQEFLLGNASVITKADLATSFWVGSFALGLMLLFWKEYVLASFDPDQTNLMGFSSRITDPLIFMSIVIATVIGIKAVGLVLMVAFVVTPPAAARQWTTRLGPMVALSAAIGAVGSTLGAYISIVLGDVATGPVIVLILFAIFAISLLGAPKRGLIARGIVQRRARRILLSQIEAQMAEAAA